MRPKRLAACCYEALCFEVTSIPRVGGVNGLAIKIVQLKLGENFFLVAGAHQNTQCLEFLRPAHNQKELKANTTIKTIVSLAAAAAHRIPVIFTPPPLCPEHRE